MRAYQIHGTLLTFSLALFGNTWFAGFAFDDNFAVVSNGDVTGSASLAGIWQNDFWGQQIRSDQSHKSYRPVTILSLRLVNWAGKLLPNGLNWHSADKHDNTGGLNAFPFHLANVVVHAINSCLVYRAALLLIALKAPCADLNPACQQRAHIAAQGNGKGTSHTHTQQQLLEACIAALLFAAHPIHTEAVAGIVGHAELLSAALALLALMTYMSAASKADWGNHYQMLTVSMLLLLLAALAKEIGITMAGALVLIDIYLLPWPRLSSSSLRHCAAQLACHRKVIRLVAVTAAVAAYAQLRSWLAGDHLVRIYRKVENPIPFADPLTARLTTGFLHAKYFHLLLLPLHLSADWSYACVPYVQSLRDPRNAATAAVYTAVLWVIVSCKPWQVVPHILAGSDQTSHSQCKTAKPGSERTSSRQQQQQPTATFQESGLQPETEVSRVEDSIAARHQESVWQMVVVVGLVIAPFSPAANVLFYVGTFIAERLLYLPSFGYCLLLAHYLTQLIGPHGMHTLLSSTGLSSEGQPNHRASSSLSPHLSSAATADLTAQHGQRQALSVKMHIRSWLGLVLLSVLLMGYSWRTVTRNLDWEDEETLFVAAQKVCMNSGKVRLNSGILERRHSNWDKALHHFRRAREIDDTYCEPDYWIGASLLQQGKHVQLGLMELEKALRCKYVAANALNALQQVYQLMGSEAKEKAASHQAWASILLKPELGRVVEACQLLEQVAHEKVQLGGSYASAQDVMKPCLVHLKQAQSASQQAAAAPSPADAAFPKSDKPLLVTYTNSTLTQLMVCTKARGRIFRALSQHRPDSEEFQDVVYKYLQRHMPSCRLLQAKDGDGEQQQVATVHLHLIHLVQSADSEDPWFQLEWGEIMGLENRLKEASLHLQVAAALFITHLDQVPSVRKRGIANPKDASQLAVMCLRRVQQLQPSDICQVVKQECDVYNKLQSLQPSFSALQDLENCQRMLHKMCM
ncbi:hypothetical protein WJX77_007258 [Trebouxia sp. C0004]